VGEAEGEAFVLQPGEGREIDLGGFRMSVKATRDETGGAFSLLEADEPAGFGTLPTLNPWGIPAGWAISMI